MSPSSRKPESRKKTEARKRIEPRTRTERPKRPTPRNEAERRAPRWYRLRGYRVLDTNVWCGHYELDVVVRRGGVLVFCEVKSKSGDRFGHPAEMVTPEKQRRLRIAAETWLKRHRECRGLRVRFDVMVDRAGRLEHLRDAF